MLAKGTVEVPYECALIPRGQGKYLLPLRQKSLKDMQLVPGAAIRVSMEILDKTPRRVVHNEHGETFPYVDISA